MLNLTMDYNYVPGTVRYGEQSNFLGSVFLDRNQTTQSSLYWGESLLSTTWAAVCRQLQDIRYTIDYPMATKGTLNYRRRPGSEAMITDLDFFDLDYQFITISENSAPNFTTPRYSLVNTGVLDAAAQFPNIWLTADALAKAAYSTVLTDLGQTEAPHNLLVNQDQLQHFTANFSHWREHIANARPGPATQDYATLGDSTGPLAVKPSVFVMDYLCQVPRRKALPNLIVSVLVADLVFLQATWQIYKLVVEYFFVKKIAGSQWCEGCKGSAEAISLTPSLSQEDLSYHE